MPWSFTREFEILGRKNQQDSKPATWARSATNQLVNSSFQLCYGYWEFTLVVYSAIQYTSIYISIPIAYESPKRPTSSVCFPLRKRLEPAAKHEIFSMKLPLPKTWCWTKKLITTVVRSYNTPLFSCTRGVVLTESQESWLGAELRPAVFELAVILWDLVASKMH